MQNSPKVSVCMITYNHEKYIREAIEGVLMQQTDFPIELILANDCSTDSTDTVIQNMLATHPKAACIRYFHHPKNVGMMPNFIFTLGQCQGKYIALCEGDDYWTDPYKLQKQVDFLEANPDYGICFHEVKIRDESSGILKDDNITRKVPETTNIEDLARGNFIHTPSVMLRNDFKLPSWFYQSPIGDYPLYCFALKERKIFKIEEEMSVYRMHTSSVWSNKSVEYRKYEMDKALMLIKRNIILPPKSKKKLLERLERKSFFQRALKKVKQYLRG